MSQKRTGVLRHLATLQQIIPISQQLHKQLPLNPKTTVVFLVLYLKIQTMNSLGSAVEKCSLIISEIVLVSDIAATIIQNNLFRSCLVLILLKKHFAVSLFYRVFIPHRRIALM